MKRRWSLAVGRWPKTGNFLGDLSRAVAICTVQSFLTAEVAKNGRKVRKENRIWMAISIIAIRY